MPQVRLWNDNKHDHREFYKGDQLHIPAGKSIVLEEEDAIQFRGQYFPIVRDVDGQPVPTSFKMLRMEKLTDSAPASEPATSKPVCQACKYEASSDADLKEHLGTHKDSLVVDEQAEAEIKARKARKTG